MKRRQLLGAAAAGVVALAAPAVRAQAARVVKFVPQADLAVLDPVWTTATVTRNHGYLVFDTLYGTDAQFRIQPQMVAGHVVENDGKLWLLTFREGLRFHDGEPVRAQDVVASLLRWAKRDAFGSSLMAATDELAAASDRVVRFRLRKPFPLLPDALGKSGVAMPAIMPERLARTDAMTRINEMVGSGPYRFLADQWRQGAFAAYQRFEGYMPRPEGVASFTAGPKRAWFDRVEWHSIPDAATTANALLTGEIDWWERASADLLPMLKRNPGVVTRVLEPTGALQFLRFNHLLPPFDNPAIRRAILGAVSQTDCMLAAGGDDRSMWNDRCGAFTPDTPLASDAGLDVLTGPRDLDKVRRDLAAAGYKGERVVMLGVTDVPEIAAICEVVGDMLRRIGLALDYQSMDWGTAIQRRNSMATTDKGGWNVHNSGFAGVDMASPAANLAMRGNGMQAWAGWPTSPRLEGLRDAWFEAPDLAAQKRICDDIQLQIWQDVPYIPLGLIRRATAYRADLRDMPEGGVLFTGARRA